MLPLTLPRLGETMYEGERRALLGVESRRLVLVRDRGGDFTLMVAADGEKRSFGLDRLRLESRGRRQVWTWSAYAAGAPQTTWEAGEVFAKLGFGTGLARRLSTAERSEAGGIAAASRLRLGLLTDGDASALAIFTVRRNKAPSVLDVVQACAAHVPPNQFGLAFRWRRTRFGQAWWPALYMWSEGPADAEGRNTLKAYLERLGFGGEAVDLAFGPPQNDPRKQSRSRRR